MIYWVYSCDYSLLEALWSKLLALLDFIHISYIVISTKFSAHTLWLDIVYHNTEKIFERCLQHDKYIARMVTSWKCE